MNRRAQSSLEYIILIIVFLGAFLAIQNYVKRGFQGRWKASVDDFGDQYDPRLANGVTTYTISSNSDSQIKVVPATDSQGDAGYFTNRVDQSHAVESKNSYIVVGAFDPTSPPPQ